MQKNVHKYKMAALLKTIVIAILIFICRSDVMHETTANNLSFKKFIMLFANACASEKKNVYVLMYS